SSLRHLFFQGLTADNSCRPFSLGEAISAVFRQKGIHRAFPKEETQMAGVHKKGDAYYCTFRFQRRRYYFTIGNVSEAQAQAKGASSMSLCQRYLKTGFVISPRSASAWERSATASP